MFCHYKNVCLTGPGAKSGPWAFRDPKPRTQNPEPKTIEVLFFWGCPKIFLSLLLFSPFSLLSPNSPIDRTEKNVQSARYHTCFRYGTIVIPMVFALALFVHAKIPPKILLPQIFVFLSTPEGLKKCIFYVGDHDCVYIYIHILIIYCRFL